MSRSVLARPGGFCACPGVAFCAPLTTYETLDIHPKLQAGMFLIANIVTAQEVVSRLFARIAVTLPLNLLQNLSNVVARWILHRREIHVGLELLEPQHLADRQNVPVVEIRGTRGGKCTAVEARAGFRVNRARDW
jgi:hypothetical protein